MPTLYHQIQGLYTAGDVLCAIDSMRALPEFAHVLFVNHDDGLDGRLLGVLQELNVTVRRSSTVATEDLTQDVQAVFYHLVGNDDARGEYVRFRTEPDGVRLCAWIHTPGLCGTTAERYNMLRERGCSTIIFDSTFSLHNTPGIDVRAFPCRAVVNPVIDAGRHAAIVRANDGVFRIGRWSRGNDSKYSDDFVDVVRSIDIPGAEFLCMGLPGKFRDKPLPPNLTFVENGAMPVEELLAQLDVLIFKTHEPTWHEGWCRTVTEAMAAGVVPVVENRGGLVDQVIHGYNGFLCDTNEEFKHYCEALYHDPALRARLSANGRVFAQRNFDLANLRRDLLQLLGAAAPVRLNYGCGTDILPGYVNCDTCALPGVDTIVDIDPFYPKLPFADGEFDEIIAYHVLEHVANKNQMIAEMWRIARHNAVIKIKLPDRNHSDAFVDPTHLSFWEVNTIDFYLPGHQRSYYSNAKFGLLAKWTTSREIYWELLAIRHELPAS